MDRSWPGPATKAEAPSHPTRLSSAASFHPHPLLGHKRMEEIRSTRCGWDDAAEVSLLGREGGMRMMEQKDRRLGDENDRAESSHPHPLLRLLRHKQGMDKNDRAAGGWSRGEPPGVGWAGLHSALITGRS
ncbi:hypothetical protein NDU88_002183 [Pleurodeles waltl]|uniref:Uncharacterized protein n=1 Tax=Pleurodeles waltl TaxID=8319 RepID=A0AAV7UUU8_PLEWA|nr:hypothetical protein NDU88_002183 [Pleurodeles waltl]